MTQSNIYISIAILPLIFLNEIDDYSLYYLLEFIHLASSKREANVYFSSVHIALKKTP